jgi:hypothetical protein
MIKQIEINKHVAFTTLPAYWIKNDVSESLIVRWQSDEADEEELSSEEAEGEPDVAMNACSELSQVTCASSTDCQCVSERPTVSRCFYATPDAQGACQVFDLDAAGISTSKCGSL